MVHFEVKRAKRGRLRRPQWVAVISAANGEPLFTSETYTNRGDAIHAAEVAISSIQQGTHTEQFHRG